MAPRGRQARPRETVRWLAARHRSLGGRWRCTTSTCGSRRCSGAKYVATPCVGTGHPSPGHYGRRRPPHAPADPHRTLLLRRQERGADEADAAAPHVRPHLPAAARPLLAQAWWETRGVVCPSADRPKAGNSGLILLGGANRHFEWTSADVAAQVAAIARASPHVEWQVCDSRRTPERLREALPAAANLRYRPWQSTSGDFLEKALAAARYVWVTADSASMLYEALSASAQVGVIALDVKRPGRDNKHARGIRLLLSQGHVFFHCRRLSFGRQPDAAALLSGESALRRDRRGALGQLALTNIIRRPRESARSNAKPRSKRSRVSSAERA